MAETQAPTAKPQLTPDELVDAVARLLVQVAKKKAKRERR